MIEAIIYFTICICVALIIAYALTQSAAVNKSLVETAAEDSAQYIEASTDQLIADLNRLRAKRLKTKYGILEVLHDKEQTKLTGR